MPDEVRVAVPWYRPGRNATGRVPDYYLHKTEDWLVLPYELTGLSDDELRTHKPWIIDILAELKT